MRIINAIIGILIIIFGSTLMSITIFDEPFETFSLKIAGFLVLAVGVFYLKRIAKFGKQ